MKTIKAVIVHPKGVVTVADIEDSLESFQHIVGGYIEPVFGDDYLVYVNEEGMVRGLPYNPLATEFTKNRLPPGARLFGSAVILGAGDHEGNETSVHQRVVDHFMKEI